jgi:hypothetical protein
MKYKISGNSRTWNIMLYKVDEKGDPILDVNGDVKLLNQEQVIKELKADGVSNPKSTYFDLIDDLLGVAS